MEPADIDKRIKEIENQMSSSDFWQDERKAQEASKELNELKKQKAKHKQEEKKNAIVSIFSGAGGEDAEDFVAILFEMYKKYIESRNWKMDVLHSHENAQGGYKNISFEINFKGSYEVMRYESGVHRLVRISPFNAKKQRHTSFAMVEVIPHLEKSKEVNISDNDIKVEFSRSGGPGGQNVDKRETSVRMIHIPTNISVNVSSERSQEQNREKALRFLKSKIAHIQEDQRREHEEELSVSKDTSIEWGNHIRSYVFHPYQMVKDHRTGVEINDLNSVLEGDIQPFIDAERQQLEE